MPGCRRPLRRTFSGGSSSTPVSEARTTQPSFVSSQRPGRRPLRSSVAPITRAVGERDRRGAVPRLHQAGVEGVEALAARRACRRGPRRPPGSSSSSRAAASGRRARAARARCRTSPSREPPGRTTGSTFCRSSPKSSEASCDSRARIQLTLPRSVLISPLWAIIRYGCASSQLGKVLVEKREWTSASALASARRAGRGRTPRSCGAISIPL